MSAGRLSVFGARGKRLYAASHRLSTGFESPPDPLKDQARATCALALIAASSVDHDLIIIVRSSLAARHLAQLHADLSNQSHGVKSRGKLDYNGLLGHYNAKQDLHFGDVAIGSTQGPGKPVFDFDNIKGQNAMDVTMKFGHLAVTGKINFTDITRTVVIDKSSMTSVDATDGGFNITVAREDGKKLAFAHPNGKPTEDDIAVRKLLAFFQLFAFDLTAEGGL